MSDYEIIKLDLDKEVILELALEAHRRDMKLNDLMLELIEEYIAPVAQME